MWETSKNLWRWVFANGPGDLGSIPGRVISKTQKTVLDASLLNTQHYKVRVKGKVEQSREGVAPSPTPWCSSYRKGSLRVTLDYGRQLYFTYIFEKSSFIHLLTLRTIYISPHHVSRMWHKVNFLAEFNGFWIQDLPSPRLLLREHNLSHYLPISVGKIIGFIHFPRVLELSEMPTALSRREWNW